MAFSRGCSSRPQFDPGLVLARSLFRSSIGLALSLMLAGPPSMATPPLRETAFVANEFAEPATPGCELNSVRGDIQHVIYIQFSHLHFTRDNPNVPSDLEQMPHLVQFLESNGTLLTNHHSVSPSQPEGNFLASLTGLYPERFSPSFASSLSYWTTPPEPNTANTSPTSSLTDENKHGPAPWVAFTRAGCNVGVVAASKMSLENTGKDILNIFGANSLEAAWSADPGTVTQAAAQLTGIAIHCAAGNSVCSFGTPDLLPNEPRGYQGFSALFGHKNAAPIISPNTPLVDLDGRAISDAKGAPGFPGFAAISPSQSLAYVAAMQEHGVPVTFAYISDTHQARNSHAAFGPGEAGYVAQLRANDEAFEKFFARLAADGINQNNTLFVVTSDESEHFTGGAPVPATCDGVNVPCTYSKLGETAWNHGIIAPDIDTTFLALAGPGINVKGVENDIWSDHTDTRPTMLALLGLRDDYPNQGRALTEVFQNWALPNGVRDSADPFLKLAQAYKRISAPVAEFALTSLRVSAAASSAAQAGDKAKHNNLESQLVVTAALCNDLSAAMANLLNAAAFHGRRITEPEVSQLVRSANDLVEYMKLVAANGW